MKRLIIILAVLVLSASCTEGADEASILPAGWNGAVKTEIFQGAPGECSDEVPEPDLAASVHGDTIRVLYDKDSFNCAEKFHAYIKNRDGGFDVLLQPADMHPDALTGCVCSYRIRLNIDQGAVGDEVSLFRRPNYEENSDPQPYHLGDISVDDQGNDCDGLVECNTDQPCENEEMDPDELGGYIECISLSSCDGAFCVFTQEACLMECGTPDCGILESSPAQVDCI